MKNPKQFFPNGIFFPLIKNTKVPGIKAWTEKNLNSFEPIDEQSDWALRCDEILVFDFDLKDKGGGGQGPIYKSEINEVLARFLLKPEDAYAWQRTPSGGFHIIYLVEKNMPGYIGLAAHTGLKTEHYFVDVFCNTNRRFLKIYNFKHVKKDSKILDQGDFIILDAPISGAPIEEDEFYSSGGGGHLFKENRGLGLGPRLKGKKYRINKEDREKIIEYIENKKNLKEGKKIKFLCPCHEDRDPSAEIIFLNDEIIQIYCWAGCDTDEIFLKIFGKKPENFNNNKNDNNKINYEEITELILEKINDEKNFIFLTDKKNLAMKLENYIEFNEENINKLIDATLTRTGHVLNSKKIYNLIYEKAIKYERFPLLELKNIFCFNDEIFLPVEGETKFFSLKNKNIKSTCPEFPYFHYSSSFFNIENNENKPGLKWGILELGLFLLFLKFKKINKEIIIYLSGPPGAGKSTAAAILGWAVDAGPTMSMEGEIPEPAVLKNKSVLIFDNINYAGQRLETILTRLTSLQTNIVRKKYTNDEMLVQEVKISPILTSIHEDILSNEETIDRIIFLELEKDEKKIEITKNDIKLFALEILKTYQKNIEIINSFSSENIRFEYFLDFVEHLFKNKIISTGPEKWKEMKENMVETQAATDERIEILKEFLQNNLKKKNSFEFKELNNYLMNNNKENYWKNTRGFIRFLKNTKDKLEKMGIRIFLSKRDYNRTIYFTYELEMDFFENIETDIFD